MLSRRFGSALMRMGFKPGDDFGMVLPNIPEFPIAFFGAKRKANPGTSMNEGELKSFLHSKVAPYKQLKGGVHFVESIPKSSTGKILRRELKAVAWKS